MSNILSKTETEKMFTQYLEYALIEFEEPHNMSETERLDVYRQAFHKTVNSKVIELSKNKNKRATVESLDKLGEKLSELTSTLDSSRVKRVWNAFNRVKKLFDDALNIAL